MFNFSEEIKLEIIGSPLQTTSEKLAFLSAFIRTSGSIISHGGYFGFEITTESVYIADFITSLLTVDFSLEPKIHCSQDLFSTKDKFTFYCVDENSNAVLQVLKIVGEDGEGKYLRLGIDDNLIATEDDAIAYIKGAFLGGGSCTIPEDRFSKTTGYHLEIVFANVNVARGFCDLLCEFEILAKLVTRKDSAVIYVKSKEVVSDILNLLSAEECIKKLNEVVEKKDKLNNQNRANNCATSNIDKTLTASVNQVRAIETIRQTVGLKRLDKLLFEVAEARLVDKNASMQELADRLKISKSCINHRMRKIIAMSKELEE